MDVRSLYPCGFLAVSRTKSASLREADSDVCCPIAARLHRLEGIEQHALIGPAVEPSDLLLTILEPSRSAGTGGFCRNRIRLGVCDPPFIARNGRRPIVVPESGAGNPEDATSIASDTEDREAGSRYPMLRNESVRRRSICRPVTTPGSGHLSGASAVSGDCRRYASSTVRRHRPCVEPSTRPSVRLGKPRHNDRLCASGSAGPRDCRRPRPRRRSRSG
jgi:hypothetical protein